MFPATGWDGDEFQAWTVMGRLRARQGGLRNHAIQARRRVADRAWKTNLPPAAGAGAERDEIRAAWHGSATVLALLFAPPDSASMHLLRARREYFDIRTGDKWDLFFPGYYSRGDATAGSKPPQAGPDWAFDAVGFDLIRGRTETQSRGRWRYSGNSDLVLVGGWLPEEGEVTIDWESTASTELNEPGVDTSSMTLGAVVETITSDLDRALDDPVRGLSRRTAHSSTGVRPAMRDLTVDVLSGVLAALATRGLGVS
jgi:hypothetical protein